MRRQIAVWIGMLLLVAVRVVAQSVGTIADSAGQADVLRAGTVVPAAIGMAVQLGDTLRTARPGRLRVVFQDDSVVSLGDDSELQIDTQVFDPTGGTYTALLRLVRGRLRAVVSEYYQRSGARYEIETPSAVSGVRGTEFVVTFDPVAETTAVVGISQRVAVHSVEDRVRHGVVVTAHELTEVVRGHYPTPPRRLDEATFRQYLEGLEFIGEGRPESQTVGLAWLRGADIPPEDRAAALPPPVGLVTSDRTQVYGPRTLGEDLTEEVNERRDPSGIIGNSPAVLQSVTGKVGVDF